MFAGWFRTGLAFSALIFSLSCATTDPKPAPGSAVQKPAASKAQTGTKAHLPALPRGDFNRLAALLDQPLFWAYDKENPGRLDPNELVVLGIGLDRSRYLDGNGQFSDIFYQIVSSMTELRRREALARELNQGRPTLVHSDMKDASAQDKSIVRHITRAARIIEELYASQTGALRVQGCARPGDMLSQAVIRRNQGPWCQAPQTDGDPFCNACPNYPKEISGLYPLGLQSQKSFCKKLTEHAAAKELLNPFTVVRTKADGQGLEAIPYNEFYSGPMSQVAQELRQAAAAIDKGEQAFKTYLLAAAAAFESNDWVSADEAWAQMNASNSKWYLRVGPDEVYFEPCNRKAGFHLSFARIDPDSIYWQEKLTPLRNEMEQSLADLIGPSYKARQVNIHMPDFIAIILNAGDDRSPMGATIGQSLPNWGKVAEEGRSRTVVMSNLYTDPDSRQVNRAKAESLLSPEAMKYFTEDKKLSLLGIVLHEATHNFGPHSDTKIEGKRPGDIFGGALATILEEVKAQTGALYFVDLLRKKELLSQDDARRVYLHSISWAFGHISRGLFDARGRPKPYSHVSGLHVGFLVNKGALTWDAQKIAANGTDKGCFVVNFEKIAPAIEELMQAVGRIKASGDKQAASTLIDPFIRGEKLGLMQQEVIAQRALRFPKASFTYSVTF